MEFLDLKGAEKLTKKTMWEQILDTPCIKSKNAKKKKSLKKFVKKQTNAN